MGTLEEFERSARAGGEIPAGLVGLRRGLWLALAGRWEEAHDLSQEIPGSAGAWLHAWLHRQEGDYGNACYWYDRAGRVPASRNAPLDEEWREMARAAFDS